jgi:hypothetical protein
MRRPDDTASGGLTPPERFTLVQMTLLRRQARLQFGAVNLSSMELRETQSVE